MATRDGSRHQVRHSPDVEYWKLWIDAVYGPREGLPGRLHVNVGTRAQKDGESNAGILKNGFVHARWRRHVQAIVSHIPNHADDLGFLCLTPISKPQSLANRV